MSHTSWNSIRDFDPLRSVLQIIPDYIWLKDKSGVYLACNHAVAWLLGATEKDIIGKTDYDFLDEELANAFRQKDEEALATKDGLLHEEWVTRKEDGQLILLETRKTQVYDLNGDLIGILSVGRDITERKQYEEQLELLNHAFNQVNEAIFLTGEDGRFALVNDKACFSLGYAREELLGMSVFDIDPNITPETFQQAKVSFEQEFAVLESHHKTKDGRIFPIEVSASHIVYQGKNYGMALVRDITERKAIERQLALLNYAIDQVSESIWLIDEEGNIHYVNQEAYRSRGYTHEEILELNILDIGANLSLEMWREHWRELKEKKSLRFEVDHITKEGRVFPAEVNANYFEFDGKGYNLALSHDISERRKTQDTLQRSEALLTEAQRIAHIGSWEVDIVNNQLFWSDETFRIWEIDKSQFAATIEAFYETVHPDDLEKVMKAYNESIEHKTPYQVEHRLLFPDGRIKHIAERGEVFYDESGNSIRFVGTSLDITEQQNVKDTLEFVAQRGWKNSSESFLHALSQYLAKIFDVDYVVIDKVGKILTQAETVALYVKGDIVPNMLYDLIGTPCDGVMNGKLCLHPKNVQQLFPDDQLLVEMQVESYAGLPLWNTNGEVIGLIAIMDTKPMNHIEFITSILQLVATSVAAELERQHSEQILRQSEQQFRVLAETLPSPVFRFDKECRRIYMNPIAEKIAGIPAEELLYKKASDSSPLNAEELKKVEQTIQCVLDTGEAQEGEILFRVLATEQIYYFHNNYAPEFDANGEVASVIVISHDITERKQMEEKLRLREQEFRVLVETSPSPIIRYDENCRRVYVNPAVEKISGKSAAELLETPLSNGTLKNGVQNEIEQILQHVLKTGQPTENEVELVFPDGRTHYFFNRYAPELDANGKPVGVVLVGHDITLRKQAENLLFQREQEFRTLVDNLPSFVLRYDHQLKRSYANRTYLQHIGMTEAEFLQQSPAEMWQCTNMSAEEYLAILAKVIQTGKDTVITTECVGKQGLPYYCEARIVPEFALDGQVQSVLVLGFDVTARYRQQLIENNRQQVFEKIAHNESLDVVLEQVALYVESSKSGRYCTILTFDEAQQEFQIVAAPSLPKSYIVKNGSSFFEIEQENCTGWLASVLNKKRVVLENLSEHPCYAFCKGFVHEIDAKACWAEPILSASNQLLGVVSIYLTQTGTPDDNDLALLRQATHLSAIAVERKRIEQKMSYQASYDALTGLPNRRLFNHRLHTELLLTDRNAYKLALLFIDLDNFKEVNDTLGHDTGDKLLIEAANRIQHCVRESDTVARLGGDEFVVILPNAGEIPPLERIAEAIIKTMVNPFYFGEYVAYVSASVGIAVYPQDADNAVTLMSCADQAMYSAKELGRNSFSFFTPSMQEQAHQRLYLVNSLRRAIEKNELEMYYQPIVDVKTGKVTKAEALIRWTHSTLGAISPAVFIPLAEETNLIQEIGSWIFHQAADMAKRWNLLFDDNGSRKISINMSPRQLTKGNGEQMAMDYLKKIELDSRYVVIEITEGLLLDNSPEIVNKLAQLRDAGIELSLDDFGTGYSAISYLKKFNLDYLKIDRSFVKDLETDDSDRAITEAIVAMAHRLGLKVIAEGVETDGQRQLLAAVGCEFIQGYFYSKPLPAEAFLAFTL